MNPIDHRKIAYELTNLIFWRDKTRLIGRSRAVIRMFDGSTASGNRAQTASWLHALLWSDYHESDQ